MRLDIRPCIPLFALLAGCASADVSGDYSITVTNGARGCPTPDLWEEGGTADGIDLRVTQDPEGGVVMDVGGTTGFFLGRTVGDTMFTGEVAGSAVTAALIGDITYRSGMCTYEWRLDVDATASGDLLEGTITWAPLTNMHADCGELDTCRNTQAFNGTRPPTP